jgi:hypothetical protein
MRFVGAREAQINGTPRPENQAPPLDDGEELASWQPMQETREAIDSPGEAEQRVLITWR